MRFEALEVSLEVIRHLRGLVEKIRRQDPKLAEQIRTAASSVTLNLAEGSRRGGKDRRYHFRVAAGSADEVRAALRVAEAWGYLEDRNTTQSLKLLDRLLGMLWSLSR